MARRVFSVFPSWGVLRRAQQRELSQLKHTVPDNYGPTLTEEQVETAAKRHEEMRNQVHKISDHFPLTSQPPNKLITSDIARRKRMIYRSKQRGWLEVDLLLGTWAEDNLMKLSNSQVEEYEKILEQDTRDLYNWLLDKEELPDDLKKSTIMKALQQHAQSNPLGKASPSEYEKWKPKLSN